jgi:hypothetical protein
VLENYSGILSLASILIGIGIFFFQQHREKKIKQEELNEKISLFCKTILKDIKNIYEAINGDRYLKKINKENATHYTVLTISTNIYTSLLHSGIFTNLGIDTQLELDEFYYKIQLHNEAIDERNNINTTYQILATVEKDISTVLFQYDRLITEYEVEINLSINKLETYLKEELKKVDSKFDLESQ